MPKSDPFKSEEENAAAAADLAEWETVAESDGYAIDFERERDIVVMFRGERMVTAPDPDTGQPQEVRLLLFKDSEGKNRTAFSNYTFEQWLADSKLVPSAEYVYRIVWEGKQDIGKGRTLNVFNLYRKAI